MKQKTQMIYRQGDVLFTRIPKLPAGERKKRENATVAYGEVTGHSHQVALADRECVEVLDIAGGLYVHVSENGLRILPGEDALEAVEFEHEEHGVIALPPGNYRVDIQREYDPAEIRSVMD